MTISKCLDFSGFSKYEDQSGYTTMADMQRYMANQNSLLSALATCYLWQPSTTYEAGQVIKSPSMPSGYVARCKTAGTSSDGEPSWHTGDVTDNSVTWTVTKIIMDADKATSDEGSTSNTYATKDYVDTSITNLSNTYATKDYVESAIAAIADYDTTAF
jgi:hypothetical protein